MHTVVCDFDLSKDAEDHINEHHDMGYRLVSVEVVSVTNGTKNNPQLSPRIFVTMTKVR
jgi:hypothetical protein